MRSVRITLSVVLALAMVLAGTGCGEKSETDRTGRESLEMSESSMIEYAVNGDGWRAISTIQPAKADVKWIERIGDQDSEPVERSVSLSPEDFPMVEQLVQQAVRSIRKPADDSEPVAAEATMGESNVRWSTDQLHKQGPGQALRRWAESRLNLVMVAGTIAAKRAQIADDDGDEAAAALLWKQAVDRLGDWWKPDEPILDETGNRYVLAKGALERERYREAIRGFRRVYEMRSANYVKTREQEDH